VLFSKQPASGLQAHHSADKCLASCSYNDGVVQAVTFAYLIYCWVSCYHCDVSIIYTWEELEN